jgi:hypothetical protein
MILREVICQQNIPRKDIENTADQEDGRIVGTGQMQKVKQKLH